MKKLEKLKSPSATEKLEKKQLANVKAGGIPYGWGLNATARASAGNSIICQGTGATGGSCAEWPTSNGG